MFNKLKNNNKGSSAINLVFIVLLMLSFMCAFIDFFNIVTIKRSLYKETDTLASTFVYQGGFSPNCPTDWTDMFGAKGRENYITRNQAIALLENSMNQSFIDKVTPEILKNGKNINSGNNWRLENKEEAEFTCKIKYSFNYISLIGFPVKQQEMKRTLPVCGFWIHKTSNI